MTHAEDRFVEALKRLDLDSSEDVETLSDVVADMVRHQSRYLVAVPWLLTLVFLGVAIFSAVNFFQTQDLKECVLYATLFLTAMIVVALLKLWFYLVWVRNSILREIKRGELRLWIARSAKNE